MSEVAPPTEALAAALGQPLPPDAVERLATLVTLLRDWDRGMNLVGEREPEALWLKHVADSLLTARAIGAAPACLADVGSGNGLPGLVLASVWPECAVTLVESSARRCEFLEFAAGRLGLAAVSVVAARAEDAGRRPELREALALVTARRVAPLAVLLEYALPLLAPGGRAVLAKGRGLAEERAAAEGVPELLGGRWGAEIAVATPAALVAVGLPDPRRFVVVEKVEAGPERYPRRAGRPTKQPLGGGR